MSLMSIKNVNCLNSSETLQMLTLPVHRTGICSLSKVNRSNHWGAISVFMILGLCTTHGLWYLSCSV